MDTDSLLLASVREVLDEVVKGPIVDEGKICVEKFRKHRIRAQGRVIETPSAVKLEEKEGEMAPINEVEIKHCAAVIAAAFLDPIPVDVDYDRFAESAKKREEPGKYFSEVHLGIISRPATLVDKHGKIIMWYLPGLLLPDRVKELNRVTKGLKVTLCNTVKEDKKDKEDKDESKSGKSAKNKKKASNETAKDDEETQEETSKKKNWRTAASFFTCNGAEAEFGAGNISLSMGTLNPGHWRLEDPINSSPMLDNEAVREWLRLMVPVERLLDGVLQVVYPDMWDTNSQAISRLIKGSKRSLPVWPTIYPAMDIIANRLSPKHTDRGGALSFYDHLVCFGQDHDAQLFLHDLDGQFMYKPGTSMLFSGKALAHSVPKWTGGERLVIAHYAKDDVNCRLDVPRPSFPTQLGWWSKYS